MRVGRLLPDFLLCLSLVLLTLSFEEVVVAQQPASSSTPQGLQLLRSALAVLTGNTAITDVTLSGTARRIAGSHDEAGTAVFKALATGAGRTDLSLSSGSFSELSNLTTAAPAGSWSGPDGVSHPIAYHNLLTEPTWFFPAFAIARRLSTSAYVATYIGHETHNGQAVEHISVSQTSSIPDSSARATFGHLTQVEFFLDSATLLPAGMAFDIHPDNNALINLPVEICFSDYRPLNGAQIPFHVQKFLNNSLILDFQAQSATSNSGLSASTFAAF